MKKSRKDVQRSTSHCPETPVLNSRDSAIKPDKISSDGGDNISFVFSVLGMEPSAMHMLGKHSTSESQPYPSLIHCVLKPRRTLP